MVATADLVEERFDDAQTYAEDSIEKANEYMEILQDLLDSLVVPDTNDLSDIVLPSRAALDYGAVPTFSEILNDFPTFDNLNLPGVELETIPDITSSVATKNFNFTSNIPSKPDVSYPTTPTSPSLASVALPNAPSLSLPDVPVLSELTLPAPIDVSIANFDATAPTLETLNTPGEFSFVEGAYNSDLRVALFNKILDDIINGGTGLDVDVEQDLWDRFLSRQINENDRLYSEIQNQFAATGFGLPSGAYASRLLQISSEIAAKNDDANRDIAIKQAELAQNNTQFAIEQAGVLEQMLVNFFNEQQNRGLQAQQILASNAIEVYNAIVAKQNLLLTKYQTEAQVFEAKVRAELTAVEIYKAQIEGVKAEVDIQESRVNIYNAQLAGQELFLKIYQTELDSAKTQLEFQNMQLAVFKTQTEAYLAQISGEQLKVDIYKTEVDAEKVRADSFQSEVTAYEAEVRGQLGSIEAERIRAENKIKSNQLKLEEYRVKLDEYKVEIDSEIKTADLSVRGYQANVSAFQAQTGAKEMEFRTMISELSSQVEITKAELQKALALIESETNSYVALKELSIKGTEGIMNVNAQLAASAMNAVNASASQSIGSSSSDNENHNYNYYPE